MRKTLAIISAALLGGCSVASLVGQYTTSVPDETLQQRTSQALGLKTSAFTISNRTDQGVDTRYTVKTNAGRTYSCYVTSVYIATGRDVSDAVCSSTGGGGQPKTQCNDLLKAAGKC